MEKASIGAFLAGNPYPGRGILVGMSADGNSAVYAYFIMGRSANSRNRVLLREGDSLYTRPFDESKVKDPSLIIYRAARYLSAGVIVTNGDQTDTIYDALANGGTFEQALATRTYEPDAPNYTPRISALLHIENGDCDYQMSILRKEQGSEQCERAYYAYAGQKGLGHLIHTYLTDGDPLPSYSGAPREVAIVDDIRIMGDELWAALDKDNKIALYVSYINLHTGELQEALYNKYES